MPQTLRERARPYLLHPCSRLPEGEGTNRRTPHNRATADGHITKKAPVARSLFKGVGAGALS